MTESEPATIENRFEKIMHVGPKRAEELWEAGIAVTDVAESPPTLLADRFELSEEQAKQMKGSAQGVARKTGRR